MDFSDYGVPVECPHRKALHQELVLQCHMKDLYPHISNCPLQRRFPSRHYRPTRQEKPDHIFYVLTETDSYQATAHCETTEKMMCVQTDDMR